MSERNFSRIASGLVLAASTLIASGGAAAGDIQVTDAWSRPTLPGTGVGVAYLVINNGGKNGRLVRVSSSVAARAELHQPQKRRSHEDGAFARGGDQDGSAGPDAPGGATMPEQLKSARVLNRSVE
ncbi:MAG TPA: copper chaperone PCu(A)C [Burkholderiales bacterium]